MRCDNEEATGVFGHVQRPVVELGTRGFAFPQKSIAEDQTDFVISKDRHLLIKADLSVHSNLPDLRPSIHEPIPREPLIQRDSSRRAD